MTVTAHRRGLAFIAMIFAVAMTFIDQTIVSVAAPQIQADLGLSSTGLQWGINSYLLATAALFAFGGRLADTIGSRRTVTVGVVVFAAASALCGLTPTGRAAEAWLVTCRALQGVGGALMYPAALAIVVTSSDVVHRGRRLAAFFGIAGGLTAVGPALGGYLTAWTWRAIFWINIPVALVALVLIARSRLGNERRPARLDVRGLLLVVPAVGLSVFGLQQSVDWGWADPRIAASLAAGAVLLVGFVLAERRTTAPLMDLSAFGNRSFVVDNLMLFAAMTVFVPLFFLASEYGQIALGRSATEASLVLLYFFAGFAVAAQFGGRMLDRIGARRPVLLGAVVAAVGLHQWAGHVALLSGGSQVAFVVMTGVGMGLLLGQANTDALNRAPDAAYGEATGIIQTVRNFGSSLGLAATGSVLASHFRGHLATSLTTQGVPSVQARHLAAGIAQLKQHGSTAGIPTFVRLDFASATGSVLTAMSWVMAATAVVAFVGLPRRRRHNHTRPAVEAVARPLTTVGSR